MIEINMESFDSKIEKCYCKVLFNFIMILINVFSVIEGLGGKQQVMHLLSHEDPNVRYQALLCVQKLMVHNWSVVFHIHYFLNDIVTALLKHFLYNLLSF